jgi:hypothetical protein
MVGTLRATVDRAVPDHPGSAEDRIPLPVPCVAPECTANPTKFLDLNLLDGG